MTSPAKALWCLILALSLTGCESLSEALNPNVSGVWEGREDTLISPYIWRFSIIDIDGRLGGTYEVSTGDVGEDGSGRIEGTRLLQAVTFTLIGEDYNGRFEGIADEAAIEGTIEYGGSLFGVIYDLTLYKQ